MLRKFIRVLRFVLIFSIPVSSLSQTVPATINYQGRLLQNTTEQDAVTGTIEIVFSIWSGPVSDITAVQLWNENWTGVSLANGIFSVLLGSNGSPLDPASFQANPTLYLQLEIEGETLLPRQQLGSAPFAMTDEPANELQDLSLTNNELSLSGSAQMVNLADYLDNTDEQDLSLSGSTLSLSGDSTPVDLTNFVNTDNQQLSLSGNDLQLTSDDGTDTVSLAPYLDNSDNQDLSLNGNILSLTNDATPVDLSGFLNNTDNQQLSLSGNSLQLTSDDGTDTVNLAPYLDNSDNQQLSLSGNNLRLTSDDGTDTVSLASYLDNTDSQNLSSVLTQGNDAGNRDITNIDEIDANSLVCPDCVDTSDIAKDTIGGNDINDNIFILHIDCNGSCADMSMKESCDVIENLRGLTVETELIGVSCIHGIPSTTGNGFVDCGIADSDNECRAFNLRTLGDIPCINGDGTDAIVTCLQTDIAK